MTAKPPSDPSKWDDLRVRILSGAAMMAVGAAGVILGGVWFQMMVVFVTAVMVWELWLMIEPARPTPGMLLAALLASVLSGQLLDQSILGLILFLVVPALGAAVIKRERLTFFIFALGIQLAGWGLVQFRGDFGFLWILWLICVVVATDIFGYFAGRSLGGPKFWPRVSPKKTWSGTAAGWFAAAIVGFIFTLFSEAGYLLVFVSMLLSFASQMGDVAESALKRRMEIKDSSTLIPGHGGLLDRFDGLLGASLFMLLITYALNVSGVVF